jgi:hypothetical protein
VKVNGIVAGVLEEHETKHGVLVEVSRNFMATDKNTGDVYYFGEDVDNYKDGKVINHDSSWRAGTDGARFGLMIPARPMVGQAFYQEIALKARFPQMERTDELDAPHRRHPRTSNTVQSKVRLWPASQRHHWFILDVL